MVSTYVTPVQKRSERFRSAKVGDFDTVSAQDAVWRYTPIEPLETIFRADLDGGAYPYAINITSGVECVWVDAQNAPRAQAGLSEERASAAAWGKCQKVLVITLSGVHEQPIIVTRDSLGNVPRAAHTIVIAQEDARAQLVFMNQEQAHLSENIEFVLHERAELEVVSVQYWKKDAIHLASHFAKISANAHLKHILVTLSGKIVRINPSVQLSGERSAVDSYGVDLVSAHRHAEHHVYVHHEGAHTRADVNYKTVVYGQQARAAWVGDVLIGTGAVGTDSYEQNRNLLLDRFARADSVPNLEIETGDIIGAGHASATGHFDEDHMFYLQSRGIPASVARRMIVQGFLIENIDRIGSADIRQMLVEHIDNELMDMEGKI